MGENELDRLLWENPEFGCQYTTDGSRIVSWELFKRELAGDAYSEYPIAFCLSEQADVAVLRLLAL